jgi:hypothetical protein
VLFLTSCDRCVHSFERILSCRSDARFHSRHALLYFLFLPLTVALSIHFLCITLQNSRSLRKHSSLEPPHTSQARHFPTAFICSNSTGPAYTPTTNIINKTPLTYEQASTMTTSRGAKGAKPIKRERQRITRTACEPCSEKRAKVRSDGQHSPHRVLVTNTPASTV